MALCAFMREQRKDCGLTQLDVAELTEMADRFFSELERTAVKSRVVV